MQSETPVAAANESKLHFLDYLRIIRIRKMIIIMVWLLVVITAVVVTNWLPKFYMSSVRMDVQKDVSDIALLGSMQTLGSFDPYFIQTQFERIKSISVLYKVIEELELNTVWATRYGAPAPYKTQESAILLDKRMEVRNVRNTSIIEIRVYSEVPEEAARIAKRIAEVYRDNRLAQSRKQAETGISSIKDQLEIQRKEVDDMQVLVDKLRVESDVTELGSPDTYGQMMFLEQQTAMQTENKRIEAYQKFIQQKTKYDKLMELQPTIRRTAILPIQFDEGLFNLMRTLSTAEQDRVTKEKEFGPEHVEMVKVNNLVKLINQQIDERMVGIMSGMEAGVGAAQKEYEALQEDVTRRKDETRKAQQTSQKYMLARRDLEGKKIILEGLQAKIKTETVNMNIGRNIVDITDAAQVGLKPVRPSLFWSTLIGIVGGLILGIGLAFFIEYLDTSVKTIDDVERALGAPVLGVIPQNVGSIMEEGPESPHAEAYRVLRTNLIFSRKDPSLNAITVVSGGAGEGKSTTILNLATIFAQNGQRVLLVDSDLRRPSLHKRLNVSNSLGLTNFLLNQKTLEEVIQTTKIAGLDFLPSGRLPSSSLGILNSPHMKEFIREVKKRYDFVFFDSPPIMGVSDASILVSEMDMTLLVIQYRKYPQAMSIRSKQTVDKVGGNLVGVVLNNINIAQDAYYYYYSGYAYNDYVKQGAEEERENDKKAAQSEKAKLEIKQKY
jgi:succinoglycan biosynthesis transport protein ExoP